MRAVVVWESMYGNTRLIAREIADGLADIGFEVELLHAEQAAGHPVRPDVDLVVIGAPTHAFGLPTPGTRREAAATISERGIGLELDPQAARPGVREWLDSAPSVIGLTTHAAAFDTRVLRSEFAGHAARRIATRLRRAGVPTIGTMSFFVSKHNELRDGELARAHEWGRVLAHRCATVRHPMPR